MKILRNVYTTLFNKHTETERLIYGSTLDLECAVGWLTVAVAVFAIEVIAITIMRIAAALS